MASAIKFSLPSNLSLKVQITLIRWITTLFYYLFYTLPSVANDQKVVCKKELTYEELSNALKGTPNNKSPGNDG